MGRGGKSLSSTIKPLDFLEQTVCWHIYFKDAASEGSEGHEESDEEILNHLRESLNQEA